ncbi:XRE family transcriptional regulator [Kribbella sp. NPDC003557]|uniref:XRE family transcriptional regulator n=1 Tax=Kribbella sp. NPDC003557 TaxID=3154449 RepID=UPI0033A22339
MSDAHTRNVERQIEWYGEPLGDRFGRLLARTSLSQAQLAGVLGLSAPMLSQLMSGHRSKISSPAVLSRLLSLEAMVGDAAWDTLPPDEQSRRLDDVRAAERSTLNLEVQPARPQPTGDPVTAIQEVLRAVASAAELEGAARLLESEYPDLAEALRVLGTGRTPDARAFYARLTG